VIQLGVSKRERYENQKISMAVLKEFSFKFKAISNRIIKLLRFNSIFYANDLAYTVYACADDPNHGMLVQLGLYYDMRYWRYYKRLKFLAGLSSYNDDEIVEQIEREEIENTKEHRNEINELHLETEFVKDNVSRLLLGRYPDLNIRELALCHQIIGVERDGWDPSYFEIIARIISKYMKLFFGLKHIQDTIQDLIHKEIVIPMIVRNESTDKPYILLTLNPELEEQVLKSISGDYKETGVLT
jgi:hypothetical protein